MSRLSKWLDTVIINQDQTELIHDQNSWYSTELFRKAADELTQQLKSIGLRPDDRVLLALPNSFMFAVAYTTSLRLGLTVVPVNPALPESEIRRTIQNSSARAGLFDESLRTSIETMDHASSWLCSLFYNQGDAAWTIDNKLQDVEPSSFDDYVIREDSGAVIMYTSGTTGRPKEVLLEHQHVYAAIHNVIDSHELSPEDTTYCFLPLFHINAQVIALLSSILSGGRIVMAKKFSASQFWKVTEEFSVTWISAVPAVIAILVMNDDVRPAVPNLRFVRSASAPLPRGHLRAFERKFSVPVIESYGMTEAAGQICITPVNRAVRKPGSVGIPVGLELQIVDDNKEPAAPGVIGEITIRGSNVITAYNRGEGANSFHDGWFFTGDLGYKDTDGYVFITGRTKEMINRSGEKIHPRDVEEVLYEHSGVKTAAVIGLPDEVYGERVEAFVIQSEDYIGDIQILKDELMTLCKEKLVNYKRPARIHVVSSLPVGATGKVKRLELQRHVLESAAVAVATEAL